MAQDEDPRALAAALFGLPAAEIDVGEPAGEPAAAAVRHNGRLIGYLASTWSVARSVGYSGKPIDIAVAVDRDGVLRGARLIEQREPILTIGITPQDLAAYVEGFVGLDLAARLKAIEESDARLPDAISGATVSSGVIRAAIIRTARAVASSRGFIGETSAVRIDRGNFSKASWQELLDEGAIARRRITLAEADAAFGAEAADDAEERRGTFIDLHAALLTPPRIGQNLIGQLRFSELVARMGAADNAILIAADGLYSFKGTAYRKSGTFERIELVQGERTIRFTREGYDNLRRLAADGAPAFRETGLFVLPAASGFDPAKAWRLRLIATRRAGEGAELSAVFELPYRLPARYLIGRPVPAQTAGIAEETPLWQQNWQERVPAIAVLCAMLTVLAAILIFQDALVRRYRLYRTMRLGFLAATLVLLGWWMGAQLSVVHVLSFIQALLTGFQWEMFLLDPLVFILWGFVAVALLFWGRGVFCGWLCPFGALQELLNEAARALGVTQIKVPFGLHERLWPVKYVIFLGLLAISLNSVTLAFKGAEVEPFKTAITLKFMREWPFVAFAVGLLAAGLFIERFYCRYLCPLGGALAIPARLRMFDWLKRRPQCGRECHVCATRCTVQAIHPDGHINVNECIHCLNCQMLYYSETTCPPLIERAKRRERRRLNAERARAEQAAMAQKEAGHG